MLDELLDRLAAQRRRRRRAGQPVPELLHELGRHGLDILGALAQRRQPQAHHREAVEEVGAEGALVDRQPQVAVGGGDDARVDGLVAAVPHRLDLPVLQRAQQLGLGRGGELADLVEEERPAVGQLEGARAIRAGRGEGALDVPEELALHQVLGDRPAVSDDEGLLHALAHAVDLFGQQLLARAGLAVDQHRGVGPADGAQLGEDGPHLGATADHRAEALRVVQRHLDLVGERGDADQAVPQLQLDAVADGDLAEAQAVDEGAVGAVQVLDLEAARARGDAQVITRHRGVGERQVVGGQRADVDLLGAKGLVLAGVGALDHLQPDLAPQEPGVLGVRDHPGRGDSLVHSSA